MNRTPLYLIIGAGIAGLAAAMRLLDYGIQPLIVDRATFPCHKVCGEFFSPECIPILKQWNSVPALLIDRVCYFVGKKTFEFSLPRCAGSESRYSFDARMIKTIEERGGIVKLNMSVSHMEEGKVILDSGEEFFPKALFIGTGRKGMAKPSMPYRGIKAHMAGLGEARTLEMHLFSGGYLGISPIEGGRTNIACLVKKEKMERERSPEDFIKKILKERLHSQDLAEFPTRWLEVEAPSFGTVSCPLWKDTYFIGDAIARIPPSSGGGLATAVLSGVLAVEYAIKGDWRGYHIRWKKELKRRLFWDRCIHVLMMRPYLAEPILKRFERHPTFFHFLFEKTRNLRFYL